jgi:hypothetical protein
MNAILEQLSLMNPNDRILVILPLFLATYASMIAVLFTMRRARRNRSNRMKKNYYDLLLKGNEQKTLDSDAIKLIYRKEVENSYEFNSYTDFLESFLIYIRNDDKDGSLTRTLSPIINTIIAKENEEKPYQNINERERRILLAIEDSANKYETSSLKNNLKDLSIVIENNQKNLNKQKSINKWSIPISVIGIILSIFMWIHGSSLTDKDVQRISSEITESVYNRISTSNVDSLLIIEK